MTDKREPEGSDRSAIRRELAEKIVDHYIYDTEWERNHAIKLFLRGFDASDARVQGLVDALEVYAAASNWYEYTKNGRLEFHDGQDVVLGVDHAREALADWEAGK